MKDFRLTGKSRHNVKGSLALRVLLISLILLVFPLIIHSFFLYREEYRKGMEELFTSLNILGESRVLHIERMVHTQINILDLIATSVDLSKGRDLNNYFEKIAQNFVLDNIFYLSLEKDGKLLCVASSSSEMIGVSYNFLKNELQETHFASFGRDPVYSKTAFYVGKVISKTEVIVVETAAGSVLDRLATLKDSPYPIDLSLVTKEGVIFASSDPSLITKSFGSLSHEQKLDLEKNHQLGTPSEALHLELTPIKGIPNAFEMKNGSLDFAVKMSIKGIDLSLLLDISEKRLSDLQVKSYIYRIGTLLFFILVVGGGLSLWITFRIAKPLNRLFEVMSKVAQGDMQERFQKDSMGFEINTLGEHFNQMIESLIAHQREAEKERTEKVRLSEELKIGHEIQTSLFPSLPDFPGLEIAPGYIPAREVSGDFYDLFVKETNKLFFIIADTAGKDIPACLYSLGIRSMLRSFAMSDRDLAAIVKETNNLFCLDTKDSGIFVTAWIGIYDPNTHELSFSSAGHYPALLKKKNGEIVELQTKGIAFGSIVLEEVNTSQVKLESGDLLLLYTDGIVEAQNKKKEFYGQKRLREFLMKIDKEPSKEIIHKLFEEIKTFSETSFLYDDVTSVAIRVIFP